MLLDFFHPDKYGTNKDEVLKQEKRNYYVS